ncbi:MAG: hypothetical protein ABIR66_06010 [Saprospiraceae bacterium]
MKKEDSSSELGEAIQQLEKKQAEERQLLKEQFHIAYESVEPVNLIKNTFKEISETRDLKDHIINTVLGLSAGYLSKMLFVRASKNPMKKMVGNALMLGISNAVIKHPELVKSIGIGLFRMIRKKINPPDYEDYAG